MALHKIEKGLDLPIPGKPLQVIRGTSPCTRVALVADDYPGMKPRMHVAEGDTVKRGQLLFEDRKMPGVIHTAPGAGKVIAVNRGEKRVLQTVVIDDAAASTNVSQRVINRPGDRPPLPPVATPCRMLPRPPITRTGRQSPFLSVTCLSVWV